MVGYELFDTRPGFRLSNEGVILSLRESVKDLKYRDLVQRVYNGDKSAKEPLTKKNLLYVFNMTKRYAIPETDWFDCIYEAGCEGLAKAINRLYLRKHDIYREGRFKNYCKEYIHSEIKDNFSFNDFSMKTPRDVSVQIKRIEKISEEYEKENGEIPSNEKIAEINNQRFKSLHLKPEKIERLKQKGIERFMYSLDRPLSKDDEKEGRERVVDSIKDENPDLFAYCSEKDFSERLGETIESLDIPEELCFALKKEFLEDEKNVRENYFKDYNKKNFSKKLVRARKRLILSSLEKGLLDHEFIDNPGQKQAILERL